MFGLRQEAESAHLERGHTPQRFLSNILSPMEAYLRPLFPLLRGPEARYLLDGTAPCAEAVAAGRGGAEWIA